MTRKQRRERDKTEVIISAARSCFEQYGVQRTRMEDVAARAGVSRQLVYQRFGSREALIDAVIDREVLVSIDAFSRMMPKNPTLAEAILATSDYGMRVMRAHPLLAELYKHSTTHELHKIFHDSDRALQKANWAWWGPVIANARKSGELTSPMPDKEILNWILSVYSMFMMQDEDMPVRRRKYLLKAFVLPLLKAP